MSKNSPETYGVVTYTKGSRFTTAEIREAVARVLAGDAEPALGPTSRPRPAAKRSSKSVAAENAATKVPKRSSLVK